MSNIKLKSLETRARRAAHRVGLRAVKSRSGISLDNFGDFMLLDMKSNFVVEGRRFDMSPDEVIDYFDKLRDKPLEAKARLAARRDGLIAITSCSGRGLGGFMLVDRESRYPVCGINYDLTPEDVIEYCEQ